MNHLRKIALLTLLGVAASSQAFAMTIGYYDNTREEWGFVGNSYLTQAKQWLINQGHTLVATNKADAAFLGTVDAFYTGLISSVSDEEVSAFHNFVNTQGGFLFIQTDWTVADWTGPANKILSTWGIAHGGSYFNDYGNYTVGSSSWVTDPNLVAGFMSQDHSVVTQAPENFEVLAKDDAGRTILGVFDAGAGRSSDVLISTDINMWDNAYGWADTRNQKLWENIWSSAATQIDDNKVPDAFPTLGLFVLALASMLGIRRRMRA